MAFKEILTIVAMGGIFTAVSLLILWPILALMKSSRDTKDPLTGRKKYGKLSAPFILLYFSMISILLLLKSVEELYPESAVGQLLSTTMGQLASAVVLIIVFARIGTVMISRGVKEFQDEADEK